MEEKKKMAIFEQMPVPKAVLQLIIPTIISSLVMVVYNLADTYFVGMANDPIQNAAVTLAAPVLLAFNAVNNLFGVGTSSMMSRALGAKDYETAYKSSAFGFYMSFISGVIFSVLAFVFLNSLLSLLGADSTTAMATAGYLKWTVIYGSVPIILNVVMSYLVRAEGMAVHASIGTMSGCILNIILDPVFILPFGFNLGAEGAGLATFISNVVACIYFLILLLVKKKNTYVCINPKKISFNKEIILGISGVGVPAAIQNLLNVTGMTILNNFTSSFGPDAVAAMGISQKINMVPIYIAFGISQGMMPIISYTYADKNYNRMKNAIKFSFKITIVFMILTTVVLYIFSGSLVEMFMKNQEIVSYGERFLRGLCLGLTFLSIDFFAVGIFQALGKGKEAFLFAVLRKIVLEIPALYILNHAFPLFGLAYAQTAAELILSIAAVLVVIRIFKKL